MRGTATLKFRLFDSALAAEGEDADLKAGLSEVAHGHGGLRSRIGGQGRKLVRRGSGFVREKACSENAPALQDWRRPEKEGADPKETSQRDDES
jgi:hypothetical protein